MALPARWLLYGNLTTTDTRTISEGSKRPETGRDDGAEGPNSSRFPIRYAPYHKCAEKIPEFCFCNRLRDV